MPVYYPHINPIRFRPASNVVDWNNTFPNSDNIDQRVKYFEGENVTKWYKPHLINKPLIFQFALDGINDNTIQVVDSEGNETTLSSSDITPTGWVGSTVRKYTFTPSEAGVYYFNFDEGGYVSDKFVVVSREKYYRQLLQVSYYNSENDFEAVFVDDSNVLFNPTIYLTGLIQENYANDLKTFETERGVIIKNRSTPKNTAQLILSAIHRTQLKQINRIFSCDNITINGIKYQNSEVGTPDRIGNSDLFNITINIEEIENINIVK